MESEHDGVFLFTLVHLGCFCESSCGSLFASYLHTHGCPGSDLNFSLSFDINLVLLARNYYREQSNQEFCVISVCIETRQSSPGPTQFD